METEKTGVRNDANPDEEWRIRAVCEEQEQVKELLRRGAIRHYFLGPESIWSQEGFGVFVGGALAVLFGGFILPRLFLHSSNSEVLKIVCWIMAAVGAGLCVRGVLRMYRESQAEKKQIPDHVHDEILACDMERLKKTSIKVLNENIPETKDGARFDEMEMLLVKGPREYSSNVNLPLVWKLGDDGRLRYSNFSVMALYFGREILYLYTCIFNMRNGTARFHHTYTCPYDMIRFAGFEDGISETVTQNNKKLEQNLKMLVIDAGEGESDKLSMPVADYDVMKRYNGTIDISDAETAVKMLNDRMKGMEKN